MTDEPLRYAVLLERPADLKALPVAEALGAWKKVPAADMMVPARRCWGVLGKDLSKSDAGSLSALCGSKQLPVVSLPSNLIEEPPPAAKTDTVDFALGKRMGLLCAAAFKRRITKTVKTTEGPSAGERAVRIGLMVAGLPVGLGGTRREVVTQVEESDLVYYADLILRDPIERLRIDAQNFDYSCLGARKSHASIINFRTLLELLADAAPSAPKNRGCSIILDGKPVREMGYEGLEDLEKEERWLMTLKALGKLA